MRKNSQTKIIYLCNTRLKLHAAFREKYHDSREITSVTIEVEIKYYGQEIRTSVKILTEKKNYAYKHTLCELTEALIMH